MCPTAIVDQDALPAGAQLEPGHDPARLRRFLLAVGVLLLLEAGLLLGLVMVVNPRGEFPPDLFQPVISTDLADRVARYNALDEAPESIIVGNSRARHYLTDQMTTAGFGPSFNFAVDGGELDDALAIYRYAVATNRTPENLIVALDPFQLRPGKSLSLQLLNDDHLGPYVDQQATTLDYLKWGLFYARQSDYVADALRVLWFTAIGYPEPLALIDERGNFIPLSDWKTIDTPAGQQRLDRFVTEFWRDYTSLRQPAPASVHQLVELLASARDNGTATYVFIAPYHPDFLGKLNADTPFAVYLEAVRNVLLGLCQHGVHTYDFSDATALGATLNEFTDGVHLRPGDTTQDVLNRLGDPSQELCAGT